MYFETMETDYSKIASRYDKNEVRRKTIDQQIEELLNRNPRGLTVLDLACGTGKYLKLQCDFYRNSPIKWMGADRSAEMLAVAENKGIKASFICCDAQDKSIAPDSAIDYIRNEYAWHHFVNHNAVISNIYRMLKPGGLFKMVNICPEYMKSYWVHHYFPGTRSIDKLRFIGSRDLHKTFTDHGFEVKIKVKTIISKANIKSILQEAENRDISQLTLLSEEEYCTGLDRIRTDLKDLKNRVFDMSFLELEAAKKSEL